MKRLVISALMIGIILSMTACGKTETVSEPDNSISAVSSAASAADEKNDSVEPEPSKSTPDNSKDRQAILDKLISETGFKGVVYVSRNGEKLCSSETGIFYNEIGEETPITENTLFCIGSVSKQFTAAAVMLLCEQGRLSVDDTLDKYYPEYIIGKDISIKNLLTMRSGIPDYSAIQDENTVYDEYGEDTGEVSAPFEIYAEASTDVNIEAIEGWIFNQPLNFEPDTAYEYSNSNYLLLGDIVTLVSNVQFEDFVRDNIFEPLGMESTGYIEDLALSPELAPSAISLEREAYPGAASGAGGIVSNAKDMDKWLTALSENKLLSSVTFKEMSANYSEGEDEGYGYGLIPKDDGGVYHTGAIGTYASAAYTNPKTGISLFAVTNSAEETEQNAAPFFERLYDEILK